MLSDNIKRLRRAKGMTQEEMAERLHVVRQTISKWETGLSVPDADMLMRIAELFEVTISDLLGDIADPVEDRNAIAEQLARINEQLVIKNDRTRKIRQIVIGTLIAIILVTAITILFSLLDPSQGTITITESTEIIER